MSPRSSKSVVLRRNILAIVLLACLHDAAGAAPIITILPGTKNITVVDPTTHQLIPQFPATDGGSGVLNPILWAIFGGIVGAPLGVGGVRAGRIATGSAFGFVGVVLGESGKLADVCRD